MVKNEGGNEEGMDWGTVAALRGDGGQIIGKLKISGGDR